jgi:aminoglycoside/choline kinase family phosphotransferase
MAERSQVIDGFLARYGWADAERRPLASDASFRHYVRLVRNGEGAMLMDAPPPRENVRPFVRVARLLRQLGFSAPDVFAADEEAGLLLLEDLATRPIRVRSRPAATRRRSMRWRPIC